MAHNYGLLNTTNGLLRGIAAYYFRLLGCPGRFSQRELMLPFVYLRQHARNSKNCENRTAAFSKPPTEIRHTQSSQPFLFGSAGTASRKKIAQGGEEVPRLASAFSWTVFLTRAPAGKLRRRRACSPRRAGWASFRDVVAYLYEFEELGAAWTKILGCYEV